MPSIPEHLYFSTPGWLLLSVLATLPLLVRGHAAFAYPSVATLPDDALSRWVPRLWRSCGVMAIAALAVAMAGPYLDGRKIEKVGRGAHVMIVLDRSASMNESFTAHGGHEKVSKMEVARTVLKDFAAKGREDMLGMVTFSTSPVFAAPLTTDRAVVQAALEATEAGGMGFTAVARGLGMALDFFEGKPITGARAILLVSDGGAHLDGKTQDMVRAMFQRHQASLYWIYLRSAHGASLSQVPDESTSMDAYPEYALHQFFQTLGPGYHVYEAENPQAVKNAMADIARLKNKPSRYFESLARHDLSSWFYAVAWLCIGILLILHMTEIRQWRAA